jgi:hypothetical protein
VAFETLASPACIDILLGKLALVLRLEPLGWCLAFFDERILLARIALLGGVGEVLWVAAIRVDLGGE